jgi:hypothetical protein
VLGSAVEFRRYLYPARVKLVVNDALEPENADARAEWPLRPDGLASLGSSVAWLADHGAEFTNGTRSESRRFLVPESLRLGTPSDDQHGV